MTDDFRRLNIRRRKSDRWFYKTQWAVGLLAGISILATIIAEGVRHVH